MSAPSTPLAALGVILGRTTLAIGLLLLGFAAYQLWGTGLAEARSQDELADQLAARLGNGPRPSEAPPELAWTADEPGLGLGRVEPATAEPADAALVTGTPGAVPADTPVAVPAQTPGAVPAGTPVAVPARESTSPVGLGRPVEIGQPMANLVIPAIGLDKTVVEGTTREALRTGPGRYPTTARPGQAGNVGIAGHRTTYGAPFHDIDQLVPGDPIIVETEDGVFTYRVEGQPTADGGTSGHRIVAPDAVDVIADKGDHRLTLTACHPRYSARQRIIVTAVLDEADRTGQIGTIETAAHMEAETNVVAAPNLTAGDTNQDAWGGTPPTDRGRGEPDASRSVPEIEPEVEMGPEIGPEVELGAGSSQLGDDLGWQPAHAVAAATWAGLTGLVLAAAWLLGRLWRRSPAYLVASPTFALCLLTFFGHLDRLIPAA